MGQRVIIIPSIYNWYTQGSPSGCGLSEIPAVAQVEKGHAGNTVTAYIYRKHGAWADVSFDENSGIEQEPARICFEHYSSSTGSHTLTYHIALISHTYMYAMPTHA